MRSTGWIIASLLALLMAANGGAADDEKNREIERLLTSGMTGYMRGDYDAARQWYESAWQTAQQTPPAEPLRYEALKRLTGVETATGRYAEAEGYLQQALTWRENQFGAGEAKAIDDLTEVAMLCRKMKDYERALVVMDRVWMLHTRSVGSDSLPAADDMSRRAQIYLDLKQPENAAGALESAVGIRTKLNSADSPTLLGDLDRLGEVNVSLRRYENAEKTYRQALVIRERLYGREHADLLATLDGLAYALFGEKKYDEAEPVYQRLLGLWTTSAGENHPMIATVLDKVGIFYAEQKKWEPALDAASRANAIREHFLAGGFGNEAAIRLTEGDNEAALGLYRRALAVMDPPSPIFAEMRGKIEDMVKALEPPPAPPVKARAKGPTRKK